MNTKKCTKCHKIKLISEFYNDYRYSNSLRSCCKHCQHIYKKLKMKENPNYSHHEYLRRLKLHPNHIHEKYLRTLELHPNINKERYRQRLQKNPNYLHQHYIKFIKPWKKSNIEKIKIIEKKCKSKRERNYGYNVIYPNIINEKVVSHHINDNDVVYIPEDLHQLYGGKNHRENLNYIIKQIYGDNNL